MSTSAAPSRVRPLLARPGARYACAGDGLCCTDLHGVGPLRPPEARMFRAMHEDLVVRFSGQDLLRAGAGGACPFLVPDGCALHRRLGAGAKPRVCTRFPYGLVATPAGGRVTTSLRCSCRTLGERPLLSLQDAERALSFPSGRLTPDRRVAGAVELRAGHFEPFDAYATREREILADLASSPHARRALEKWVESRGAARGPKRAQLREQGRVLASATADSRFGAAVAWMGCAMLIQAGARPSELPARPWEPDFDRAERRTPAPGSRPAEEREAQRILADFASEALWDLDWLGVRPLLDQLRWIRDQLSILEILLGELGALGTRLDRAAAEAVMIAELARIEEDD